MDRIETRVETADLSPDGIARLEAAWRALEAVSDCSFFQSWTWIGCRIAERYGRPRLVSAHRGGATVGLALFNCAPLRLAPRAAWLHETGDPSHDRVFVEHNGPLVARDCAAEAEAAILKRALDEAGTLVMGGLTVAQQAAASRLGEVRVLARRPAPFVRLEAGLDAGAWRAGLGTSTRAQLARSDRRLSSRGTLSWERAADRAQALAWLEDLARIHRARWSSLGQAGAFGEARFHRFQAELVGRGFDRGEVSIARLMAGDAPVCLLLEFHWRAEVLAYQSGTDLELDPRASPGLVAHARSIADAIGRRDRRYDFLAGDARYKRSLADAERELVWLELSRRTSLRGLALRARRLAKWMAGAIAARKSMRRFLRSNTHTRN